MISTIIWLMFVVMIFPILVVLGIVFAIFSAFSIVVDAIIDLCYEVL